jgi:hypothetical protein
MLLRLGRHQIPNAMPYAYILVLINSFIAILDIIVSVEPGSIQSVFSHTPHGVQLAIYRGIRSKLGVYALFEYSPSTR